MPYNINKTDGTLLVTVADGTVDTSQTSIGLVGRGFVGYGEVTAENLVHIMEHFADDTAPANPLIGQLWYDTVAASLKLWDGATWGNVSGGSAFVSITGDTMTGDLTITKSSAKLTLDGTGNSHIEMGRTDGIASDTWIDFHSGSTPTNYDTRIVASSGTGVDGGGTLSILTSTINLNASTAISANNKRINNVQDPATAQDAATKNYVDTEIASAAGGPAAIVGEVRMYTGTSAPSEWLICDGSAISRTTYSDLFSIIGTAYGAGDGSTTFNIPNFGAKMPIGAGSDTGLSTRTRGQEGGAETHTLTTNEMPAHSHTGSSFSGSTDPDGSHTHSYNDRYIKSGGGDGLGNFNNGSVSDNSRTTGSAGSHTHTFSGSVSISSAGNGLAHNNMPPFLGINFIIYTGV